MIDSIPLWYHLLSPAITSGSTWYDFCVGCFGHGPLNLVKPPGRIAHSFPSSRRDRDPAMNILRLLYFTALLCNFFHYIL